LSFAQHEQSEIAREKPALSENINIIAIINNMKLRNFLRSFVCCIRDIVN